jgi:hypothetical protein
MERRSGIERRRPEPAELVDVFRPDDRRMGLGRRWEDWCRPAGQSLGADRDLEDLADDGRPTRN